MQETDLAYLAGLIDGEGCFIISMKPNKSNPDGYVRYHIEISMTERQPIDWCMATVGSGSVYELKHKPKDGRIWSDYFRWVIYSQEAASLCMQLLPYLKNKFPQALLMIEMAELKRSYKRGQKHNLERQYEIVREARSLKGIASRAMNIPPIQARPTVPLKRDAEGKFIVNNP